MASTADASHREVKTSKKNFGHVVFEIPEMTDVYQKTGMKRYYSMSSLQFFIGMFIQHFLLHDLSSGVTSHRQPRQCWGPKTVKGAQSDPNYVSRLLLDCVAGGPKIIVTPLDVSF